MTPRKAGSMNCLKPTDDENVFEIEALLLAVGAELSEGSGSRIRVALNGVRAVFHRPHPQKETDKGAVKSVRRFLQEAGIEP